jgi:hypothetical protein
MSPRHGKMRGRRRFRGLLPRTDSQGALMEKKKARTLAGLVIALALASLFLINQITSISEPTSIYTPGPRQPLAVPTPRSPRPHPHPSISSTFSEPRTAAPAPRPTPTRHATRYGTRKPVRHHQTHHARPPTHHPKPPSHHPTPPPSSPPPTKDPGILCRLLGICLRNLTHLGISLYP